MLIATTVHTTEELQQVLALQKENLALHINDAELKSQGFVTVHHTLDVLEKMHAIAPSIIIKDNNKVVAYALVMLNECKQMVPILEPMYANFETISWQHKPLYSYRFYVMGQVCIAKEYRGQGLFEQLYLQHRKIYQSQFDFIITEVSVRNPRSLRAHERIGFQTINTYRDEQDEWVVILWDWSTPSTIK